VIENHHYSIDRLPVPLVETLVEIFQFDVKECNDLKIRVRGHSRSSKVTPFDCLHVVSYHHPVVVSKMHRFRDMATYWPKIALKDMFVM